MSLIAVVALCAVLASSIGVENVADGNLLDMDLEKIKVPSLIVHHGDDRCRNTPFASAQKIAAKLSDALKVRFLRIDGGEAGKYPCSPKAHHGFQGRQPQTYWAKGG